MITVKSEKELENAIKAGHKEIYVSDEELQAACYLVNKYQNLRSSITAAIMSKIGTPAVISEDTVIIMSFGICATAVAIVAIIQKCKVKINYLDGTITIE